MGRSMTSPETAAAWRVLRRFVAEADGRQPHLALDSLLTTAEWMEVEQGGAADRVRSIPRLCRSGSRQRTKLGMWAGRI